jgi:hypothetical protein
MKLKVIISYRSKESKHLIFSSRIDLLSYQLSLSLKELEDIEAFDVYIVAE